MVWIIITVMIVALGGLVCLQASLLRSALALKEQSFRQNVQAALSEVSRSLETAETVTATLHVVGSNYEFTLQHSSDSGGVSFDTIQRDSSDHFAIGVIRPGTSDGAHSNFRTYCDSLSFDESTLVDSSGKCLLPGGAPATLMIKVLSDTTVERMPSLPWPKTIGLGQTADDSGRVDVIQRVIERLATGERVPIETRLRPAQLDSVVHQALSQYGITLEPVYAVATEGEPVLSMLSRSGLDAELSRTEFRTRLFPNDFMSASHELLLYFPDRASFLFRQIGPMLAATVLFMVVIVSGFGYAVKTILGQRRAARQMVEFVNNMTHEFKTPISTVALACEAILRPDVIADSQRVKRFASMIHDENRRMRNQTEKILQMAALEEQRGALQMMPVNVHDVIKNAVESVRLQVEHRGGRISCDLNCSHPVAAADELHLSGVIFNLLDNANKYSPEPPIIEVTTKDQDGGIRIIVADHGLGLKPEERRRIFDKYYRVQRGNIHEVKGFGLGLSYVALMVKAHNGRISVESEPSKGTRMILWFPSCENGNKPDEVIS